MEIAEILERFCNKNNPQYSIPFNGHGYTMACTGYMAVRVSGVRDQYPNDVDLAAKINGLFPGVQEMLTSLDLTELLDVDSLRAVLPCPKCRDRKNSIIVCPECDGSGEAEASNSYSDYEVECATCQGSGKCVCDECGGVGEITNEDAVEVLGVTFKVKNLSVILGLPGVHFFLNGCEAGYKNKRPAYFRFDGGEGILIPCLS